KKQGVKIPCFFCGSNNIKISVNKDIFQLGENQIQFECFFHFQFLKLNQGSKSLIHTVTHAV
nr:hypothetical protein [Ligilactobacillus acidipiscis]